MSKKGTAVSRRSNNLFALAVIVLSVVTVALLSGTLINVFSHSAGGREAGENAVAKFANGFSCTADVTLNGNEYEVKLQRPASGDATMTFVKPADLASLSFEQGSDGLKVKLGSLEAAVDPSSIPQTSVFNAVTDVFSSCMKSGISAKLQKNGVNLNGSTPVGAFTLALDNTLTPKSLSIPALKMNANFSDFKFGS